MRELSQERFDCLAGYARDPMTGLIFEELAGFATDDENVLALLVKDRVDQDFAWIALGRDERLRYWAVDVRGLFATPQDAQRNLEETIGELQQLPPEFFHQGDADGPPIDFFAPLVAPERMDTIFRLLVDAPRYAPARGAIGAMMWYFEDVDGNFIQLFQSTGFDARLWELYLFTAMTELGYARLPGIQIPDFVFRGPKGEFAIEAVTCNPAVRVGVALPQDVNGMLAYQRNYIPSRAIGLL